MNPTGHWTGHVNRALGWLLLDDPERASMSVVLGGIFWSVSVFLEPVLRTVSVINHAMSLWPWLGLGAAIMYCPTIVRLLKKPTASRYAFNMALTLIRKGDLTPAEKRQQYRRLIDHFVARAAAEISEQPKPKKKKIRSKRAAD